MTGMKQGAGENPFAEDSESEDGDSQGEFDKPNIDISQSAAVEEEGDDRGPSRSGSGSSSVRIPYKFRRNGVQDGRDRVPLFLHAETKDDERDALRALEDEFGANVSLTDLREALVMAGLSHLDEVETQLRDWGYGMTFDE